LVSHGVEELSPDEFAAILDGANIRGLDRASFEGSYEYRRPEGVLTAWLAAEAQMPAITAMLNTLRLP